MRRHDESLVERLLRRGPGSLSDAELVSLLLPGPNALETALEVLGERGLELLGSAPDVGRLLSLRGVGLATVAVLCATAELVHRLIWSRCPAPQRLRPSQQAAEYLYQRYEGSDREVVGALYLNSRRELVGVEEWRRSTRLQGDTWGQAVQQRQRWVESSHDFQREERITSCGVVQLGSETTLLGRSRQTRQ